MWSNVILNFDFNQTNDEGGGRKSKRKHQPQNQFIRQHLHAFQYEDDKWAIADRSA